MRNVPRWVRTVSIFVALIALSAVAAGVAGAQRGPQPGGDRGPGRGPEAGPPEMADAFVAHLAANLGVSEDDLRSAMAQTHEEMRPMMQEHMGQMRERMREHMEEMGPPGRPPLGRLPMDPAGAAAMHDQLISTVASALRMQPDELRQQLGYGHTVAEIARNQGVDPDALADQLTSTIIQEHQGQLRAMIREAMDHSFGGRRGPEGQ